MNLNPKIQHFVVLMLENRSFDHMLGFLMEENPGIDGITKNLYTNRDSSGEPHPTTDGAAMVTAPSHLGRTNQRVGLQNRTCGAGSDSQVHEPPSSI